MKTFIVALLLVGGTVFGMRYLPDEIKTSGKAAASAIGLSNFSPFGLLPSLKEKVLPENPIQKRERLIEQLSANLEVIAENQPPKTTADRIEAAQALQESQKLITELKLENPKNGFAASALERIIDSVIPASAATESTKASCP